MIRLITMASDMWADMWAWPVNNDWQPGLIDA